MQSMYGRASPLFRLAVFLQSERPQLNTIRHVVIWLAVKSPFPSPEVPPAGGGWVVLGLLQKRALQKRPCWPPRCPKKKEKKKFPSPSHQSSHLEQVCTWALGSCTLCGGRSSLHARRRGHEQPARVAARGAPLVAPDGRAQRQQQQQRQRRGGGIRRVRCLCALRAERGGCPRARATARRGARGAAGAQPARGRGR